MCEVSPIAEILSLFSCEIDPVIRGRFSANAEIAKRELRDGGNSPARPDAPEVRTGKLFGGFGALVIVGAPHRICLRIPDARSDISEEVGGILRTHRA